MSGTLHGSIDHNITTTAQNSVRDTFAAAVNYFDSKFTRIASQAGSGFTGSASLALPGYTTSSNRSGENAFGVWRWDRVDGKKLYILLQWGYNNAWGTSPGNPATNNQASFGVAIQFAMRLDGGNPWNGGTANLGADLKNGTNVWVDGGSTLLVWPRQNGPSGASATNKSALSQMSSYASTIGNRFSVMSDDDTIYWFADQDGGNINNVGFIAPYTARQGISTPDAGLVMFCSNDVASFSMTTQIGTTTGSTYDGGGVILATNGVRTYKASIVAFLDNILYQPNTLVTGGAAFDLLDVFLRMEDSTSPAQNGLFGKLNPDDIAFTYNMSMVDTNIGKTRICVGPSQSIATLKWLFRWDGVTTPGTTVSQTGVQF